MTNLNIPVGVSDFSQIRKNGYYYVDKTRLISELLKKKHSKRHADYSPQTIWKDAGYEYAGTFFRYST